MIEQIIQNELEKFYPEMIELRRYIHMHPEVSFNEKNTARFIKEYLEKIGKQDSAIRKAKIPPASNAFCPSIAGLIAANYVYTTLLKNIKILTVEKPI